MSTFAIVSPDGQVRWISFTGRPAATASSARPGFTSSSSATPIDCERIHVSGSGACETVRPRRESSKRQRAPMAGVYESTMSTPDFVLNARRVLPITSCEISLYKCEPRQPSTNQITVLMRTRIPAAHKEDRHSSQLAHPQSRDD